ncbi:dehydrogenase [Streptomyces sp. WAC 05379]|nr:dehydrogenase [Streptomyces sp. WAC 05379]
MTSRAAACPECRQPMKADGPAFSRRQDDGKRACRSLWRCTSGHVWWKWTDRPDESFEVCPMPELFR